jgi:DNA-binding MarR family transcriptional regulator
MNIERILENIGLNRKEIKIYLSLLKLGKATVAEISKEAHLKRTTIYPFLDELKLKGLIEWGMNKYNRRAKVKDPKQLLRFARAQDRKYGRAVLKLEGNLDEIEKHYIQDLSDVEVKYYEGKKECRIMLQELLKAKEAITGYNSWMKYPYIGENWCKVLEAKMDKKGLVDKKIISATEHNLWHAKDYIKLPDYKKSYFFKFIPPVKEFINVDVYLFDDIKLTLSFKSVKPNGIYIRNKDIVQSEKAIFNVLYKDIALEYEDYLKKHKIDPKKLKHEHK